MERWQKLLFFFSRPSYDEPCYEARGIAENGCGFMSVIFLPNLKIKEEKNYCINALLAAVAYDKVHYETQEKNK